MALNLNRIHYVPLKRREIMRGMKGQTFRVLLLAAVAVGAGNAVGKDSADLASFGIKKLAFETGPGSWYSPHEDIFVLDSLKSKPRHLANGLAATWSPDGERLAYCAHEGWGTKQIVLGQMQIINADGSGRKEVTNLQGGACPVDWSPDGRRIAVAGKVPGILVVDDTAAAPATNVSSGTVGVWSPNGAKIAFWRSSAIWIANSDGLSATKVIDDNSAVVRLCWSPDGEQIIFSSHRENKARPEIFRLNLDGSKIEKIAADKKLGYAHPLISPDGKYLVLEAYEGTAEGSIVLLNLSSHDRTVLVRGAYLHLSGIVWDKH